MKRITLLSAILGSMVMLAAACGGSSETAQETTQTAYSPQIDPASFTTKIDNKYFPLKPGTTFVYEGKFQGAAERDEMAVTHDTKRVMGVECVVASDRVTEDGKLT